VGTRSYRRRSLLYGSMSALSREIVSRLGAGVVDAYLSENGASLDRAVALRFPGAELGLQSSINFKGKTGFWRFGRSAGHSESIVIRAACASGYGESGTADKPVPMTVEGVAT